MAAQERTTTVRTWSTPAIQLLILSFCELPSQKRALALTAVFLRDSALRSLWRAIPDVNCLFFWIPYKDRKDSNHLAWVGNQHLVTSEEWQRFDLLARHVEVIQSTIYSSRTNQNDLELLERSLYKRPEVVADGTGSTKPQPLLPSLQSVNIVCIPPFRYTCEAAAYFCSPSLTSITLGHGTQGHYHGPGGDCPVFEALRTQCSLTSLETRSHTQLTFFRDTLQTLLVSQQRICKLVLKDTKLDIQAVVPLINVISGGTIEVLELYPKSEVNSYDFGLHPKAFGSLQRLAGPPAMVLAFIKALKSAAQITDLTILSRQESVSNDELQIYQEVIDRVGAVCSKLSSFRLVMNAATRPPRLFNFQAWRKNNSSQRRLAFKPLAKCPLLRSFRVSMFLDAADISDDAIGLLASSWPQLVHFSLRHTGLDKQPRISPTLQTVTLLSHSCKNIKVLEAFVLARTGDPSTLHPLQMLEKLVLCSTQNHETNKIKKVDFCTWVREIAEKTEYKGSRADMIQFTHPNWSCVEADFSSKKRRGKKQK